MTTRKFTKRNGSLVATIDGVKYVIVKRDRMGMISYRVITWDADEMTVHGEFGWLRDARAFVNEIQGV